VPDGSTPAGAGPPTTGGVSRALAATIVALRWVIVPGWIAAAVAASVYLPGLTEAKQQVLSNLIPNDAAAVRTEARALRLFGTPLIARTVVVQRDPKGLSVSAQVRVVQRALALDRNLDPSKEGIVGAIPVLNTLRLLPGSKENGTTALTYLFFRPDEGLFDQVTYARGFAERINQPGDALIGVTGAAQARFEQGTLIEHALPWVELATLALIVVILAVTFRSVGPPLLTLAAAGIAFLVSTRLVAYAGQRAGITIPQELEPFIVVLLLGIVTDYSIFFVNGMRNRLAVGDRSAQAARWTTAAFLPIVLTAGLTVAAGTASLLVARLGFLRAFGPALALTVLVSLLVSITFVPAALAMFGRPLFWPTTPRVPAGEEAIVAGTGWRARIARIGTSKPVAALITLATVAVLAAAASSLPQVRLGFSLAGGLPRDNQVRRAADAASQGFAAGVVSPSMVLLEGQGVGDQRDRLVHLQALIDAEPGVAGVLGPAQQPQNPDLGGLSIADSGNAARYVVILRDDPLSGPGVEALASLEGRMPALLASAGLNGVRAAFAGDTALVQETIDRTAGDLVRISVAILLIDLLLLGLLLRAVVAPLYLLATSVLALLASMGLTVLVFQRVLHHPDLTYYVPVAAAVLLVSLGSDYNIFVVGRIWEEARTRPLREAIALGSRRATRAVTVAGVTLAASFGALAIVPLTPFHELAFALGAGVLLDAFLVRSLLVPALIALFGRTSAWPSRGFRRGAATPREQTG
jgi:putative drug exporter of the RND superfamily